MKYATLVSLPTPQCAPLEPKQVKNNAGGYVYALDKWARLDRFLVLGADAPTYYQDARALTVENASVVRECFDEDAERAASVIAAVSTSGRAPRNDPAIFALAIGASRPDEHTRAVALAQLQAVCRTGTHLFQFLRASEALGRGWGRAFKRAVASWYGDRTVESVAYQAIKYRSREGYTHQRALELAHAPASHPSRRALYRWMKGKPGDAEKLPPLVQAHIQAMEGAPKDTMLRLVRDYSLPWEALPTEANADPDVWCAMLPHLGLTAMIRNLGNMTRLGAISPLSEAEGMVVSRLGNAEEIRRSRVHPLAILQAMAVYGSGRGVRGSGEWTASRPVMGALEGAFYTAFANVEPTNKRHLIALDVSGSMTSPFGGSVLSCRDASAALALVTISVEPQAHVVGFTTGLTRLPISPRQGLREAVRAVSNLPFGGTDCALPMLYAMQNRIPVDVFVVITDNETWAGRIHPSEALRQYRAKMGIPAKLVVIGMTSTGFSIADPNDGGMLDVVGFDAAVPELIAGFVRQ